MFIINDLVPSKTVTFSADIYYHPPDPAAGGGGPQSRSSGIPHTIYNMPYPGILYTVYNGMSVRSTITYPIAYAYLYIEAGIYLYIGPALAQAWL